MKTKNLLSSIAFILALLTFASCTEKSDIVPVQTVSYSVKCNGCLVYIEDNQLNHTRDDENYKSKWILVDGVFNYKFSDPKIDSVTMRIYVGVFTRRMPVSASIFTNDLKKVVWVGDLGLSGTLNEGEEYEKDIVLHLK